MQAVALNSPENVPAGQSEHVELSMALTFTLNLPGGHGVGARAAAGQKKPGGQALIVDEFEPAGQKKPAEHGPPHVALIIAVTLPKKPARHWPLQRASRSPVVLPYVPSGHAAEVAFVEPTGQKCPSLQFPRHADAVSLSPPYVPAEHRPEHVLFVSAFVAPYVPGGHAAADEFALPAEQKKPASHSPEHDGVPSVDVSPYVPAGQSVGVADPGGQYRPTPHSTGVEFAEPLGQM